MTLPDNRAAARYVKKNSILNQQLSCNNTWWKFPIPDHRWVLSGIELFLWWPLTTTKPPSIHLPGPSNSSGTTLTHKRIWEWKITQQGVSVKRRQHQPIKVSIEIPNHQLRHDQSFQPPPIDNANQLRQANTGNYSLHQLSREMAKWALPCKRFLPSELIGSPILPPYPT